MPSSRIPVSRNSRMIARSRRSRKSLPEQSASSRRTSSSGSTGTGFSGIFGGRVLAMGDPSISPSSSSQPKSC